MSLMTASSRRRPVKPELPESRRCRVKTLLSEHAGNVLRSCREEVNHVDCYSGFYVDCGCACHRRGMHVGAGQAYSEGSVWSLTFIKLKPGMFDVYMRDAVVGRKREMEEAKKQGLVLSHKVLSGTSANREDWDLLFMEEKKNGAAFDGLSAKMEAIEAKVMGNEEQRAQAKFKRTDVREVVGEKVMQELLIK